MIRPVQFESQDRRIKQILAALNENGIKDIEEAVDYLDNDRKEKIYVITCFSDKGKFLEKVKVD